MYLYYGYETAEAWIKAINTLNATTEAEHLNEFLADYNVKGLLLKNLNFDYNSVSTNLFRV